MILSILACTSSLWKFFCPRPAGPPTRSNKLRGFGCGFPLVLGPSRYIARGPVGRSVRRDLLGWVGEGERAEAVRFCAEFEDKGRAWEIACWYTPLRKRLGAVRDESLGMGGGWRVGPELTAGSDFVGGDCSETSGSVAPLAASSKSQSVKVGSVQIVSYRGRETLMKNPLKSCPITAKQEISISFQKLKLRMHTVFEFTCNLSCKGIGQYVNVKTFVKACQKFCCLLP